MRNETKQSESVGTWRTLVRSFGALALGEGAARLLAVFAFLLLARTLRPGDFGVVMLGVSLTVWFSLVVDAGTETLNVREIARSPDRLREIAEPILGLRLVLAVGAALAMGAASLFLAPSPTDRTLLWLFALVLPATAMNLRMMVLGVRASRLVGLGNVASQLVMLCGVVTLVRGPDGAFWVPVLRAASELVFAGVVLAGVRRRFGLLRPRVDVSAWIGTLRESLPLLVSGLARAAMLSCSIPLIGLLLARSEMGLYAAAQRPVVFAASASGLFLVSLLASCSAASGADALELVRRTARLSLAAVPVAIVISAGSGYAVRLAYGGSYGPAASTLAVLIWILPVLLLNGPYSIVLITAGRQGLLMSNHLTAAAFTVCATLVLIPLEGIMGAAIGALAGQAVALMMNYRSSVALGLAPPLVRMPPSNIVPRRAAAHPVV